MNQEIYDLFKLMKERNGTSDTVFPFKSIRTAFENGCDRANLQNLTFHDLRRTFGTRLLELGVDIVSIQRLYGHSSPLVTQRYLHPSEDLQREAVDLLSKYRIRGQLQGNLLRPCDTGKKGPEVSSVTS